VVPRLARIVGLTRQLWVRACQEHSTPAEIGWSVAIGVFSGCTPFLGAHMWIALGLATLAGKNRLWAFLGSRVSSSIVFLWIAFTEIELGHRVRTHEWAALSPGAALEHGRQLLGDWVLGTCLVGPLLAGTLGVIAYVVFRRREAINSRTLPEGRRLTSESQP
jgi:uncharacterized protein (DUF2062 family)